MDPTSRRLAFFICMMKSMNKLSEQTLHRIGMAKRLISASGKLYLLDYSTHYIGRDQALIDYHQAFVSDSELEPPLQGAK